MFNFRRKEVEKGIPVKRKPPISQEHFVCGPNFSMNIELWRTHFLDGATYGWKATGGFANISPENEATTFEFTQRDCMVVNVGQCYDYMVQFFERNGLLAISVALKESKHKIMAEAWRRSLDAPL